MLMKRIMKFFSCVVVFSVLITFYLTGDYSFAAQNNAASASQISVFLNGTKLKFDVNPYIKNGRTMVPFRSIFEALDVDIYWDGVNRSIMATNNTTQIFIEISKAHAFVNGYKVSLDVAAEIRDGRTFVPLRFVSENTGAEVTWDGNTKSVYISYADGTHTLGERAYFRDMEFTVDRLESKFEGKILTISGKTSLPDRTLIVELYDSSRKFSSGVAEVTGKDGEMNLYEVDIYVSSSFNPKYILIKTLNDYMKQIKMAQYDI